MSEMQDSNSLQNYSRGVLSIISAIYPPSESVDVITEAFVLALRSSPVSFTLSNSVLLSSLIDTDILFLTFSSSVVANTTGDRSSTGSLVFQKSDSLILSIYQENLTSVC